MQPKTRSIASRKKNKHRRTIENEADHLRSTLFWLGVLLFIALPIINCLLLQTVYFALDANIAYGSLSEVISTVQSLLSVLNTYAGLGVLICATSYFGLSTGGTVLLAMLYHPITALSSVAAYILAGGTSLSAAVFNFGIDAIAGLLIYAVIYVVLVLILEKKGRKREPAAPPLNKRLIAHGGMFTYILAAVAIYGGAQLASKLYTMIDAFLDPSIGTPINLGEHLYWITEYLSVAVYAAAGYFIILAICYYAQHSLRIFSLRAPAERDRERIS